MSFTPIQPLFPTANIADLSCAICTEDFPSADEVLAHEGTVPHAFHTLCIRDWLNVGATCPTCNLQITHVNGVYIGALLGPLLIAATEEGDLEGVQDVLQNENRISEEERGEAVFFASELSRLDIIEALLANGNITQDYRGTAVLSAVKNGQLEILEALLAHGDIPDDYREMAVQCSAKKGYLAILQPLLPNRNISDELRQKVLRAVEEANPINAQEIRAFLEELGHENLNNIQT